MGLSVAIITNNEEKKIAKTLEAVKWADEIIIVDSGSTDKTIEIAKSYGAKVYSEEWKGFGPQKNSAIDKCSNEWILNIDADEELSGELAGEIQEMIKKNLNNVYDVNIVSFWFGKKSKDKIIRIRLFKKDSGRYNDKKVHEEFITNEKVGRLKNIINHHTYISIEEYITKFNRYTSYAAVDLRNRGRKFNYRRLFLEPVRNFLIDYLKKGGITEGFYGFFRCAASGAYGFVRYSKLYLLQKEFPNILIARTDKIGDLILSLPSFRKIRDMYPESKIGVIVRNYNYDIVKNIPYIDEVIKIDDYNEKELMDKIRKFRANIFISLFTDKKTAGIVLKSKAEKRIGAYSKWFSFFIYNKGLFQKRSNSVKNESEYNLELIRKVDKYRFDNTKFNKAEIYLGQENRDAAERFLVTNKIGDTDKKIIIHPFSAGSAKNLKKGQYIELIDRIAAKGNKVIISASINDSEKAQEMRNCCTHENVYLYVNDKSILNLAALIDKCSVYIGSSTGPTHIAGIMGKKVIAIYPKIKVQSKTRWGIIENKNVTYIQPENSCEEKYKCNKQCKYYDCFDTIKIDDIMKEI